MKKLILIMCCLISVCHADTLQEKVMKQMPLEIRHQIFKDAEKKWPGDYKMMAWEAEKQLEAYVTYISVKTVLLSDQPNPFNKIGEK